MVAQSVPGGEPSVPGDDRPRSIAEMPAQRPAVPATPAEARGRFFNTGNGFNVQLPAVPDQIFTHEPAIALDPATPTGLIACDIAADLAGGFPARDTPRAQRCGDAGRPAA